MNSRNTFFGYVVVAITMASQQAWAGDSCSLLTPAEFAAIVGRKADSAPGGSGKVCTATFDGYQATAQLQVVSGFGMSGRYSGLVNFWKEENAKARKRGEPVEEKTIGDVFCSAKVPHFSSPGTECMKELPGERVLYARVSAPMGSGKAPPMETARKLLAAALPRIE